MKYDETFLEMMDDEMNNTINVLSFVEKDIMKYAERKELMPTEDIKAKLRIILNSLSFDRQLIQDELKAIRHENDMEV